MRRLSVRAARRGAGLLLAASLAFFACCLAHYARAGTMQVAVEGPYNFDHVSGGYCIYYKSFDSCRDTSDPTKSCVSNFVQIDYAIGKAPYSGGICRCCIAPDTTSAIMTHYYTKTN